MLATLAFACDNGKVVLVNKDTSAHHVTIGMEGKKSGTYEVWATQQGNPTGPVRRVAQGHYSRSEISYTVPADAAVSIDVSSIACLRLGRRPSRRSCYTISTRGRLT